VANASPNTKGQVPFKKGHKLSKGNSLGGKIEKLRAAIVDAVTPADFKSIAKTLVAMAKAGDVAAAKELYDRVLGKSAQTVNVNDAKPKVDPGELAETLVTTFGATRLPPMFQAALEQRRRAKQVDSNITSA
jgi:hypothetical protein